MFKQETNSILQASGIALPEIRFVREIGAAEARDVCAALDTDAPLLVADANTWAALGARMAGLLPQAQALRLENPQPEIGAVQHIAASGAEAIIAIGSGTVSDVCKLAAHRAGIPYAVLPTAPSMNGYTSANASIIEHGKKHSFPAALPRAVLCDMSVLARAPVRLIRAGLGDSLARPTAQADWLLSHFVKGTAYDPRPFALIAPYEPELFARSGELAEGGQDAVELLMKVLLLSGFGMTIAGGSYPASQGEHMIAASYEQHTNHSRHSNPMVRVQEDWPLHGEQIGVTTLTMARIQEETLVRGMAHAEDIRKITLPAAHLEAVLKRAGAPTTPEELGWDAALYEEAIRQAPHMRDRFTFLSLTQS